MTHDKLPPVKDPVTPEHKRFVLSQATLRLWLIVLAVGGLGVWLLVEL